MEGVDSSESVVSEEGEDDSDGIMLKGVVDGRSFSGLILARRM